MPTETTCADAADLRERIAMLRHAVPARRCVVLAAVAESLDRLAAGLRETPDPARLAAAEAALDALRARAMAEIVPLRAAELRELAIEDRAAEEISHATFLGWLGLLDLAVALATHGVGGGPAEEAGRLIAEVEEARLRALLDGGERQRAWWGPLRAALGLLFVSGFFFGAAEIAVGDLRGCLAAAGVLVASATGIALVVRSDEAARRARAAELRAALPAGETLPA